MINSISKYDETCIRQLYADGEYMIELAKKYNITPYQIKKIIWNSNKPIRIRNVNISYNEYYFDQIDTEEKAYWLGYILPGCSLKSHSSRPFRITTKLQDKEHLQNFLDTIGCCRAIEYENSQRKYASIYLCGNHMASVLGDFGIIDRKGVIIIPSSLIESPLLCHFIRGVFDYLGVISIKYDSVFFYTYSCSVANVFLKMFPMAYYEYQFKSKKYFFKICSAQLQDFVNILYKDSSVYLKYKYDEILSLIK